MDDWESLFKSTDLQKQIEKEATEAGKKVYREEARTDTNKQLAVEVKESTRDLAVRKKLVPLKYKDCEFDADRIQKEIAEDIQRKNRMYTIERFSNYKEACYGILSTLRTGNVPDRSYIIGAPNGFGKTSFAYECIMIMEDKNMRAVPYVSLMELAEIKIAEEKRLMNGSLGGRVVENGFLYDSSDERYEKLPVNITGCYSWSEYINSECLFCYFTDVASRNIESRTLYQIINTRAVKALPTVVMISSSLNPYINDRILNEQVWDEILGIENVRYGYDRLTHVSCYKRKRNAIMNAEDGN